MTITDTELGAALTPRPMITTLAALCATYPLDETNPHLDYAVREVTAAIARRAGHPVDGTAVHDAFTTLIDIHQRLKDLDDNPEEYLGSLRLPRTGVQRDITYGELLADREHWTAQLEAMAS